MAQLDGPFIAAEIAIHSREVEIKLIDGGFFEDGGLAIDDFGDEHRVAGISIHVAPEDEGLGTETKGHLHGHCGVDAIASGFIAAGSDDATATHPADDEGFALEAAVTKAFDRDEEGVEVEVEHGTVVHMTKYTSNN